MTQKKPFGMLPSMMKMVCQFLTLLLVRVSFVNTLIDTIIKHFISTHPNITSRLSNYMFNLQCATISDYRWYQNVFISIVMFCNDSLKPYQKEKFIDGLYHLFAHKVKDKLTKTFALINNDNFTYGDVISTIKNLGISMYNDKRMSCQWLKNTN